MKTLFSRSPCQGGLFALFLTALLWSPFSHAGEVALVPIEHPIHPGTEEFMVDAFDQANARGVELIVLTLNTPGGRVDSTEAMQKAIISSKAPVVAWVGPAGAHAASAGFFLAIACDAIYMAPGTRTGAATPIGMSQGEETEDSKILRKKVTNDLSASMRAMAQARGLDEEVCEAVVRDAVSLTAEEALEKGLSRGMADSPEKVVADLQGKTLKRFGGEEQVVVLEQVTFWEIEYTFRQKFLLFLGNPNMVAILFLLGVTGIGVEIKAPGTFFPGILGGICLLLVGLASAILPLNIMGAVLVVVGIILLILEVKVTSYGALTVGGVIALLAGSITLVDGPIPEMRVNVWYVVPMVLALAALMLLGLAAVLRAHKKKVATGNEDLVESWAVVTRELNPEGKVELHGELWNAELKDPGQGPVAVGEKVLVKEVQGLKVICQGPDKQG